MHADPLRRHPGRERDRELAAGAHVQRQTLLGDHPHHRLTEERLAGVVHVGVVERLGEGPAAGPEVGLVQQVCRRAELRGQVAHVTAADAQGAGRAAGHGLRPQLRQEGVDISGGTEPGRPPLARLGVQRAGLVRSHAVSCSWFIR